jgi:hypothetical protein
VEWRFERNAMTFISENTVEESYVQKLRKTRGLKRNTRGLDEL